MSTRPIAFGADDTRASASTFISLGAIGALGKDGSLPNQRHTSSKGAEILGIDPLND